MVQFTKLRLQGFKSFADKTELEIGAGLNGIVGPNGCGKSNLVEALRWVMGEGSARKMRGGGMEDVIFAGTSNRAGRNIAEVSLLMDNSSRKAPAAYNGFDEIEITRRIERDHGSVYKINGKTVRARDVQMLLADSMTGASSPALVSQGRITQIISAKPLERRMILEESAGIAGLYARRHEAELRLKAADTNLQRVSDLTGGMEGRLNALKRQARQAARYRNLSAQIRQIDILIAWLEWRALEEKRRTQESAFNAAESIVAEKMVTVTQLSKTQITQAEELPALRNKEAEAAAALQNKKLSLMRLEEEDERLKNAIQETAAQLEQTGKDKDHEAQTLLESEKTLENILGEQSSLLALEGGEVERLKTLEAEKTRLEEKVTVLENDYTSLMQMAAEAKAQREALTRQIARAAERLESLASRKSEAESEKAGLEEGNELKALEKKALSAIEGLQSKIKTLQDKKTALAAGLEKSESAISAARTDSSEAQKALSSFQAELAVLEKILVGSVDKEFPPILNDLKADSGFEKALSRALGDSLMASLDERAPSFWRKRSTASLPALPSGLPPLAPHIKAAEILQAALSQIGFVKDAAEAEKYLDALLPGQAVVSQEGDYWRWDGFCMKAAAQDSNARHLEQKNKLDALYAGQKAIEDKAAQTASALEKALEKEKNIKGADTGKLKRIIR
ncbi:MAG: AAA family ATPase [Alphaproteobacteria bacterium]|nr:AAA family ATPase [Alphaproteobacteria bacterium]